MIFYFRLTRGLCISGTFRSNISSDICCKSCRGIAIWKCQAITSKTIKNIRHHCRYNHFSIFVLSRKYSHFIIDIFLSATCNLRDCIKSQDRASFCCKRNFNARCCYYATGYNNYRPNYINNYIPHNDYGPWQNLGNNHPYNSNFHSFIYRKETDKK